MLRLSRFSPKWLAFILLLLLILWLATGEHYQAAEQMPPAQAADAPASTAVFNVDTTWFEATPYPAQLSLQGQLDPWQHVEIKAQVAGMLTGLWVSQGDIVTAGQRIATLSDEGSRARLAQAQALVKLRESELHSGQQLHQRGLLAETELIRLRSELAQAQANLAEANLAVEYREIKAPISGILSQRQFDEGSWVSAGSTLFHVVDISNLRASAQAPQQHVGQLNVGQTANVRLLDGREYEAVLTYISPYAAPASRTFMLEAKVANPNSLALAGASATLNINLEQQFAHALSPALLALNDEGRLGVYASRDKHLHFYPVSILRADLSEVWVSGLPQRVEIVTRGAGFLKPGDPILTGEDKP